MRPGQPSDEDAQPQQSSGEDNDFDKLLDDLDNPTGEVGLTDQDEAPPAEDEGSTESVAMSTRNTAILDALLGEMTESEPATSTEDVQACLDALFRSTRSPAGPDREGAPRDPAPQPVIPHGIAGDRAALTRLGEMVGEDHLDLPPAQASAVICFLDAYPRYWPKLQQCTKKIKFNSPSADQWGGGVFSLNKDKTIHLSALPATQPEAFARLFVHETGHATFESTLLDTKDMPYELNTNKLPEIPTPAGGQEAPTSKFTLVDLGKKCRRIQDFWDEMSLPAKTFYQAWLTLSEGDGSHLLGLDLGKDPRGFLLSPDRRQRYQAGHFSEFCAEAFMLYAMGDLHLYVRTVLAGNQVQPKVKAAWRNTWSVLEEVASPILGTRAG